MSRPNRQSLSGTLLSAAGAAFLVVLSASSELGAQAPAAPSFPTIEAAVPAPAATRPQAAMDLAALDLPDSPGALAAASSEPASAGESSSDSSNLSLFGDPSRPAEPGSPASGSFGGAPAPNAPRRALPTDITILPGQIAPHQTVRDKMIGSVRDSVSLFTITGEVISGGYSHLTNGSPNYGTNATAFAQRFGAAVARGTTQNLFYEGVTASIFHEDPRYFQLGPKFGFVHRAAYAATRVLVTRTDGGRATPNVALLAGYLGASALTKVYYPPLNQGFSQTLQTFGGSLGGAAIGFIATEFLPGTLQFLHLKKAE